MEVKNHILYSTNYDKKEGFKRLDYEHMNNKPFEDYIKDKESVEIYTIFYNGAYYAILEEDLESFFKEISKFDKEEALVDEYVAEFINVRTTPLHDLGEDYEPSELFQEYDLNDVYTQFRITLIQTMLNKDVK